MGEGVGGAGETSPEYGGDHPERRYEDHDLDEILDEQKLLDPKTGEDDSGEETMEPNDPSRSE